MKTVFIINPKAGSGRKIKKLIEDIKITADRHSLDADIYITKAKLDAKRYVYEFCKQNDFVRFVACGGDGTLNEVINGAMGFKNVEIGVLPVGTGNDFCRNFKNAVFKDIFLQMTAKTRKCDIIKYTTKTEEGIKSGFCVNMFNIGFDSNVVDMTDKVKKFPFISGPFAYIVAVCITLIKKRGASLKIALDDKIMHDGNLLLTSAANGRYCGGGFMSNPEAELNDGLISVNIIKNISRFKFIKLVPFYKKGTLSKIKNIDKLVLSKKCKKILITPLNKTMRLCNDGEVINAGETEIEIVHNAFNLINY